MLKFRSSIQDWIRCRVLSAEVQNSLNPFQSIGMLFFQLTTSRFTATHKNWFSSQRMTLRQLKPSSLNKLPIILASAYFPCNRVSCVCVFPIMKLTVFLITKVSGAHDSPLKLLNVLEISFNSRRSSKWINPRSFLKWVYAGCVCGVSSFSQDFCDYKKQKRSEVPQSPTQPFFVSSRNTPLWGGALETRSSTSFCN